MKLFFSIVLILFIITLSKKEEKKEDKDPVYEKLLKWGINNSLNITPKIKFVKEKNVRKYVAKNLIPEGEQIMDIPPEIMMSVNRSLNLLNSKKFRKGYNAYLKEDKDSPEVLKDEFHVDQSFLSYILYTINHKRKTYEKNKFYQFYEPMFYMFEEDLDHLPFYFSSEQMKFFINTSFGSVFEILNSYMNVEATIFEKKIFNKTLIYDDYLRYRIFSIQKSYSINGTISIVPFIDLIKKSFKDVNCEFKTDDKHLRIFSTKNIFPGEELILIPSSTSNQHSFIFFGETYDEILGKFPSYNIPSVISHFISDKPFDIDLRPFGVNSRVDLVEYDFFKNVLDIYKTVARTLKVDDSDVGAYSLFLKYLKRISDNFKYISNDDIRKAFLSNKDVENVRRIIDGEKVFIEIKIGILEKFIKVIKEGKDEKKTKKDEKKTKDKEKVKDL